jgi:hypothetical protein
MALYRIHRSLDLGNEIMPAHSIASINGTLGDTSCIPSIRLKEKGIAKLVQKGAISKLGSPPLAVLAGWSKRAVKLEPLGVVNVEQFVEADTAQLANLFKVKIDTIVSWKAELLTWLVVQSRPQKAAKRGG